MAVPTKAEQLAEANARANAGIQPGERADALDVIDDGAPQAPALDHQPSPQGEPAPKPAPRPDVFGKRRDDIVARFRTRRGEEESTERDDISDFTRSGLPPDFAEIAAPVVAQPDLADPVPVTELPADPPARPQTVKVTVRGEEKDMPLDEVIRNAQIALAADSYLDEAKGKLKEVNTLLRETRQAPRPGPAGEHHVAPNGTQPPEPAPSDGDAPQHPEDPIAKLIESIQFGDPGEAATLLRNTIAESASRSVTETLQIQRLKDEGARSTKVLKDFMDQHADLASDPLAQAAIERQVYDLQVEDLKQLGIDPARLPTPNGVVTPADVAVAHRHYRAEGYGVRSPKEMLETATEKFLAWKGVAKTETTTTADPGKAPPRVDVTVDRAARRQAIPQQPARTAAPAPDPAKPSAPSRDRSEIVRQEVARRNLARGRVIA